MLLDLVLLYRRRQQNTALGGGARQFGDCNVRRPRQRGGLLDCGAAPVGKHKTAIAAVARDAVRKGESEHNAGRGRNVRLQPTLGRSHLPGPALPKATRAARALRAVAAELIEPEIEIDAVAAEPALGEDSGNFGGLFARAHTM